MTYQEKNNTHLVLKYEWIQDNLSLEEKDQFSYLLSRIIQGKLTHDYYVVNKDEPYANLVKEVIKYGETIKEEMAGKDFRIQKLKEDLSCSNDWLLRKMKEEKKFKQELESLAIELPVEYSEDGELSIEYSEYADEYYESEEL